MPTDSVARNRQGRYQFRWHLAAAVLMACLAGGCGESSSASVSGKITHKGQPVVHGDVTFFQPSSGSVAQSALDSEGKYSLNLSLGDLPAGEYKVTVTPSVSYVEVNGREGKEQKMVTKGEKSIPLRYQGRNSSRLSATVTGGADTFDFELK